MDILQGHTTLPKVETLFFHLQDCLRMLTNHLSLKQVRQVGNVELDANTANTKLKQVLLSIIIEARSKTATWRIPSQSSQQDN